MKSQSFIQSLLKVFEGVEHFMLEEQWPEREIQAIITDLISCTCKNMHNESAHFKLDIETLAERLTELSVFNYSFSRREEQWNPLQQSFSDFVNEEVASIAAAETATKQIDSSLLVMWLLSLIRNEGSNYSVH